MPQGISDSRASMMAKLQSLIDELDKMPDDLFEMGLPLIRVIMRNRHGDSYVVVAGFDTVNDGDC